MRAEDNHTKKEDDSVRNLFSVFFKSLFTKYLPLKFQIYDLQHC